MAALAQLCVHLNLTVAMNQIATLVYMNPIIVIWEV